MKDVDDNIDQQEGAKTEASTIVVAEACTSESNASEDIIGDNCQQEDDGTAANTEIYDTFHPFPKLPIEPRLKAWEEAMPSPQIVELDFHFESI